MRKLSYFLVILLAASEAWATYIVVLKNGTRYKARERWTMQGGKAIVQLENGTTLQLDPNLIDAAKSDEATRLGYGDAKVLNTPSTSTQAQETPRPSGLGQYSRLRTPPPPATSTQQSSGGSGQASSTQPYSGVGALGSDVTSKFVSAYDNIGFYDAKVYPSGPYTLRIQLSADNEEQVFKAISATAYVMLRVPSLTNSRLDLIELLMASGNGGAAGRFQMTQEDASVLDGKRMTIASYFIRRVIF